MFIISHSYSTKSYVISRPKLFRLNYNSHWLAASSALCIWLCLFLPLFISPYLPKCLSIILSQTVFVLLFLFFGSTFSEYSTSRLPSSFAWMSSLKIFFDSDCCQSNFNGKKSVQIISTESIFEKWLEASKSEIKIRFSLNYSFVSLGYFQCDQIGRFIGLWATFKRLWQQLICPNLPHS